MSKRLLLTKLKSGATVPLPVSIIGSRYCTVSCSMDRTTAGAPYWDVPLAYGTGTQRLWLLDVRTTYQPTGQLEGSQVFLGYAKEPSAPFQLTVNGVSCTLTQKSMTELYSGIIDAQIFEYSEDTHVELVEFNPPPDGINPRDEDYVGLDHPSYAPSNPDTDYVWFQFGASGGELSVTGDSLLTACFAADGAHSTDGKFYCTFAAGERVYIKCKFYSGLRSYLTHSGVVEVGGNLQSWLSGSLHSPSHWLERFFKDSKTLISADRLVFPTTGSHTGYDFAYMFEGCTKLLYPPKVLPALRVEAFAYRMFADSGILYSPRIQAGTPNVATTSLKSGIATHVAELGTVLFGEMFSGCKALKKVTLVAYDYWDNYGAFNDWMKDTPDSGVFVTTRSTFSYFGEDETSVIPKGWTIAYED